VAQHQSQRSIFANQQYLTFSSVRAVFGQPLPGFSSVADPCSPFRPTGCFHCAKLLTLFRQLCNNCSASKTKLCDVSIQALSSYDILPITKVTGLTEIMAWNIEQFTAYYNAVLQVNIKIMTSQQRWYLIYNNKIYFLFSCEIHSWNLHFHQFDICPVNTAQRNALVHNIVTNKLQMSEIWCKKFRHFWDIAIFVLGYFILPHRVYYVCLCVLLLVQVYELRELVTWPYM